MIDPRHVAAGPVPFYSEDGIVIYHGDCREILPTLDIVDHVITDPPYCEKTHAGARTASRKKADYTKQDINGLIDFVSITESDLRECFDLIGTLAQRWVVATMAYQHIVAFESAPPSGLDFIRFGIWIKPNGAPQFTGDRPGSGWEGIAVLHKASLKKRWNGGGRHATFRCGLEHHASRESLHPTIKPLSLISEFVTLFTDEGETILDPWMGSGTTLDAAKNNGRQAIGIEIEERYCEIAANRLRQKVLQFA